MIKLRPLWDLNSKGVTNRSNLERNRLDQRNSEDNKEECKYINLSATFFLRKEKLTFGRPKTATGSYGRPKAGPCSFGQLLTAEKNLGRPLCRLKNKIM